MMGISRTAGFPPSIVFLYSSLMAAGNKGYTKTATLSSLAKEPLKQVVSKTVQIFPLGLHPSDARRRSRLRLEGRGPSRAQRGLWSRAVLIDLLKGPLQSTWMHFMVYQVLIANRRTVRRILFRPWLFLTRATPQRPSEELFAVHSQRRKLRFMLNLATWPCYCAFNTVIADPHPRRAQMHVPRIQAWCDYGDTEILGKTALTDKTEQSPIAEARMHQASSSEWSSAQRFDLPSFVAGLNSRQSIIIAVFYWWQCGSPWTDTALRMTSLFEFLRTILTYKWTKIQFFVVHRGVRNKLRRNTMPVLFCSTDVACLINPSGIAYYLYLVDNSIQFCNKTLQFNQILYNYDNVLPGCILKMEEVFWVICIALATMVFFGHLLRLFSKWRKNGNHQVNDKKNETVDGYCSSWLENQIAWEKWTK